MAAQLRWVCIVLVAFGITQILTETGLFAQEKAPPPVREAGEVEAEENLLLPGTETQEAKEEESAENLLTLNFPQIDIRELLSALSIQRELNIVMANEVTGNVSVHLYDRTLSQALDAITLAGGFSYTRHGDLYYFFKPKGERDPQAKRLKMRIFRLRYAEVDKVQEILDAIPGMRMIKIHEPSKTLIVEDTPENIAKIETMLSYWDAKPKQVMIEAKILQVTLTDAMSLGVDWQKMLGDVSLGTGGFSSVALPAVSGAVPVPTGAGIAGTIITGAGSTTQFSAALNALRSITEVNTLSTPKILAIHGKLARVQVGGQQGYRVTTSNLGVTTESVQFIDTGTILEITPYIDDEGSVLLNVSPSINSVDIGADGTPSVKRTTVSTWLLARSGQTVFLGGLIEDILTKTQDKVPCLGGIPGLGSFFGKTDDSLRKSELVVLITPRIIATENYEDELYMKRTEEMEEKMRRENQSSSKKSLNLLFPSK